MLQQTKDSTRRLLTEVEAKDLLRKASLPVIETRLARTKKEAISISKEIGFPVVMKIISPDISHKSDVGGVKLGLNSATRVGETYTEIVSTILKRLPEARIEGISIQKMARPGIELIIGMNKDPQFGPVLMFGLGGILVEVLKDVSFRLIPITRLDAAEMVSEIKGNILLKGYRGQEAVNMPLLEDLLVRLSNFVENHPEIEELDLNPVFAYRDSLVIVDARIVQKNN